jgi:hypothetical protein
MLRTRRSTTVNEETKKDHFKMAKRSTPSAGEARALAEAKLASSGLTWAQGQSAGLEVIPISSSYAPKLHALPGLAIPYFDPRHAQPVPLRCGERPPFWRLRYLATLPSEFGEEAKTQRYTQAHDTGVCAYFPRAENVDWPGLLTDVDQPLLITEGELKALKATTAGFPTVGLGGVFNFASKDLDLRFLDELEAVTWAGRCAYVVYDSDLRTNSQVCLALNRLARELQLRGAQVFAVFLPPLTADGKTGLDDYLVSSDPDAGTTGLQRLLFTASPLTNEHVLHQLNQKHVFVYATSMIYNTLTGAQQATKGFDDAYASLVYEQRTVVTKKSKKGGEVEEKIELEKKLGPATKAWLRWPLRAEAGKLTYEPARPPGLIRHEAGVSELSAWNLWPGFAVAPKEGNVDVFLQLVDFVFKDVDESLKRWFLQWCAYPFQWPGTKLYTACVFYGRLHGTGKSLLGYTLGALYGENFTTIGNEELQAKHNGWAARRQFVLGDEITGSDRRELSDRIKRMITQEKVRVDEKFEKPYELRDCTNYFFTSNRSNAFVVEDDDRRLFIHEMPEERLDEDDFFKAEYVPWLHSGVGKAALLHYLLHEVDTSDFSAEARAPMTDAKSLMNLHSKSDLGGWVARLRDDPDGTLIAGAKHDLYTNSELLVMFQGELDGSGRDRVSPTGLGTALRDAGFHMANGGQPIRSGKSTGRYYIVRRPEVWRYASPADLAAHLVDPAQGPGNVVTTAGAKKRKY